MPKGSSKIIVDAERNRRTLEKPANHFPWFGGGASFGAEGKVGCWVEHTTLRAIDSAFCDNCISWQLALNFQKRKAGNRLLVLKHSTCKGSFTPGAKGPANCICIYIYMYIFMYIYIYIYIYTHEQIVRPSGYPTGTSSEGRPLYTPLL